MKKVTKESELNFLRKLEDYFKNVPIKEIYQAKFTIVVGDNDSRGCLFAHIAKAFKKNLLISKWNSDDLTVYCFTDGFDIFNSSLNKKNQKLFGKYAIGLTDMEPIDVFSRYNWKLHPHKVIKKVINEIEKGG